MSIFKVIIYSNGDEIPVKYLKNDKVIWGIDNSNKILFLVVCELTDKEISHINFELKH